MGSFIDASVSAAKDGRSRVLAMGRDSPGTEGLKLHLFVHPPGGWVRAIGLPSPWQSAPVPNQVQRDAPVSGPRTGVTEDLAAVSSFPHRSGNCLHSSLGLEYHSRGWWRQVTCLVEL
jgi:hypothetical protein